MDKRMESISATGVAVTLGLDGEQVEELRRLLPSCEARQAGSVEALLGVQDGDADRRGLAKKREIMVCFSMGRHRAVYYDSEADPGQASCVVAKAPGGMTCEVPLLWDEEHAAFGDEICPSASAAEYG